MKSIFSLALLLVMAITLPAMAQANRTQTARPSQPIRPMTYRPVLHQPIKRIEPLNTPTNFNIDRFKLYQKPDYSSIIRPTVPAPSYVFSGANGSGSGGSGNGGFSGGSSGGFDPDWFKKSQDKMLVETRSTVQYKPLINPNFADSYQCSCCGLTVNRGAGHTCSKEAACTRQQLGQTNNGR